LFAHRSYTSEAAARRFRKWFVLLVLLFFGLAVMLLLLAPMALSYLAFYAFVGSAGFFSTGRYIAQNLMPPLLTQDQRRRSVLLLSQSTVQDAAKSESLVIFLLVPVILCALCLLLQTLRDDGERLLVRLLLWPACHFVVVGTLKYMMSNSAKGYDPRLRAGYDNITFAVESMCESGTPSPVLLRRKMGRPAQTQVQRLSIM